MRIVLRCTASAAVLFCTSAALSQTTNFPVKPMRMVVGFPAGGPADFFARTIAQKLTEVIGQQVIVDNRAGVNGMIAAEHVARSAPADGYVMYFAGTGVLAFAANLYAKLPIDVNRDLMPLTLGVTVPDMPTMTEAGYPSVRADNWYGFVVAAATPKDIAARLHGALVKSLDAPDTKERLMSQGAESRSTTPEQFAVFIREETATWGKIIKAAGVKLE